MGSTDTWDNGYPSGGNYWSDYRTSYPSAIENDSSDTWNTPYNVSSGNIDRYPLMAQFQMFNVGTWNGVTYGVGMVSNSTIKNVKFNSTARTLSFNVTGMADTLGFCRVDIPFSLMSGSWNVTVNGKSAPFNTLSDANYTYIYFTYQHSTQTVQITSTSAVPEFQPYMLLLLFMIITLLGAIILKRKRSATAG